MTCSARGSKRDDGRHVPVHDPDAGRGGHQRPDPPAHRVGVGDPVRARVDPGQDVGDLGLLVVLSPTHTASRPTVTVCGASGSSMRARLRPVAASSLNSASCRATATHAAPSPIATSRLPIPTAGRCGRSLPVRASIEPEALVAVVASRTPVPSPTATLLGRRPDVDRAIDGRGRSRCGRRRGGRRVRPGSSSPVVQRHGPGHGRGQHGEPGHDRGARRPSAGARRAGAGRLPSPSASRPARQRRRRPPARAPGPLSCSAAATAARPRSPADGKRSPGCFASARRDHAVEAGREAGNAVARRRRRLRQVRPQLGLVAVARVRRAAGQREVEDAAERVDVGAGIGPLAADLLRGDVVERPDPVPGLRLAADRLAACLLRPKSER